MREFLNSILNFIGLSYLTDDEFNSLEIDAAGWDNVTYLALDSIVAARDSVSDARQRLRYVFQSKGVAIEDLDLGQSQIFIGSPL